MVSMSSGHWLDLEMSVRGVGADQRLVLRGELDSVTCRRLVAAVDRVLVRGARRLVLDLRGLGFVDSSGLRVLLELRERAEREGFALELVAGTGAAQRLFERLGLERRLTRLASGAARLARPSGEPDDSPAA